MTWLIIIVNIKIGRKKTQSVKQTEVKYANMSIEICHHCKLTTNMMIMFIWSLALIEFHRSCLTTITSLSDSTKSTLSSWWVLNRTKCTSWISLLATIQLLKNCNWITLLKHAFNMHICNRAWSVRDLNNRKMLIHTKLLQSIDH